MIFLKIVQMSSNFCGKNACMRLKIYEQYDKICSCFKDFR